MSDSNAILLLSAASSSQAVSRLENYLNSCGLSPKTSEIIQWKLHPEEASFLVFMLDENMLQNVAVQKNLQPLMSQYVAKGNKIIPILCTSNKENSLEPTLDKVADIVHYLNYWQEQYLELRRLKRLESTNEHEINQEIETVKTINQEMGELLRICLAQQPLSFEEMERTHFADFLKRIQRTDLLNAKTTNQPTEERTSKASKSTPKIVETKKPTVKASAPVELDDIDGDDFDLSIIDKATPMEQAPLVPSKASQIGFTPINELIDEVSKADAAPSKKGTSNATMADALQAFAKKKGVEKPGRNNIQFIDTKAPTIEPIALTSNMEEPTEKKISMQETANTTAADVALSEKLTAIGQAQRQFKMQQIPEGIQTLEAALGKYPTDLHLQYQLAQALHTHTNEMERSQTLLRNILKEDPNQEDALAALADQFLKNGKYKQAAVLYDRVWKLNPEALDVLTHLALLHSQFVPTEPLHLMQIAQAAEENDGPSAIVSQAKGRANEAQGRIKEAIAAYMDAYQLDASNGTVAYDLALIHYREGNAASAKYWYEVAVAQQGIYKTPENDAAFGVHTATPAVNDSIIKLSAATETIEAQGIDQTVCITGATSGIGKATAIHFAKAGYQRLVLTGRRADRLAELKASLSAEYEVSIETLTFDVRDNEASAAALAQLQGKMAQIDVLINNAGLAKGLAPIQEGSLEHWNTMIDTNIKGILHISRLVTPGMVARRSGMIINLCSTAGKEVYPMGNVYCATKHAVDALTKGMRQDLFKYGIRVGQVSPAHVEETEFALVRMDGDAERAKIYQDFQPLKSADVADAIFYMATRPAHVNVQDILLMGTQQASSTLIDRSGR